jgi:H+/gluconate symporter-like permease
VGRVSVLAIAILITLAVVISWVAIALMVELHRASRRRNPSRSDFNVPLEWEHLQKCEYLPRIFTPRLVVAAVAAAFVMSCPWLALLLIDSDAFFELWVDDQMWAWLPNWWLLSFFGSIVAAALVAMVITHGYLCPECGRRLEKRVLRGDVLLMCRSCRIVYRAPWRLGVTGSDHHHHHHP